MLQPPEFHMCYLNLAPDILRLPLYNTVSVTLTLSGVPYRAALTAHNRIRAGSLRFSPAPTTALFKLGCLRSAPGSATTPRQAPSSNGAAAAAATAAATPPASSSASASTDSASSAAADPASAAPASTTSAAAASASTASTGEMKHGPGLLDAFFVEKVECSQGDVGYLLLTQSKSLRRRRGRRRHTRYRFAGCRRRCSQGQPCKAQNG